jgi:rSAM/selenodomain-associated transferase 2
MQISVIIPTYNESERIGNLIDFLLANRGNSDIEIIVVDGGSEDNTIEIVKSKNVIVETLETSGRANQMNMGAAIANGDIFYFVHADTFPPESYPNCIKESILNGYTSGCCAYNFDSDKWPLKINSFFTQFNGPLSGGGDQTLYVTKAIFQKLGGFNPDYIVMEDFEFSKRLKNNSRFKVLKSKALVSARKYEKNNYLRVNSANLIAMMMFWLKFHPQKINSTYKSLIKY